VHTQPCGDRAAYHPTWPIERSNATVTSSENDLIGSGDLIFGQIVQTGIFVTWLDGYHSFFVNISFILYPIVRNSWKFQCFVHVQGRSQIKPPWSPGLHRLLCWWQDLTGQCDVSECAWWKRRHRGVISADLLEYINQPRWSSWDECVFVLLRATAIFSISVSVKYLKRAMWSLYFLSIPTD